MKSILIGAILLISSESILWAQPVGEQETAEVERIFARLQDPKNANVLSGAMWTVTHDYKDFKHMKETVDGVFGFIDAITKHRAGEKEPLQKLGGLQNFKKKLADMLGDSDQAIRAFGAMLIGITGDQSFVPALGKLLERPGDERDLIAYDRGRAAMALGMIDARQYKSKIAVLLKSTNEFDRAGAITALGHFGATEYAKDIAGLLVRPSGVDDDPSPVYFLVDAGVARNYKPQLLKAMSDRFRTETATAAMYALVAVDAKEHAKDIARLLADEFRKADAAKALALLGATQYTEQIAFLLKDRSGLVRSAAALSLGILVARSHASRVAALLKDPEVYVHAYAATALMLMEAKEYYPVAVPLLEHGHSTGSYVTGEDHFDPVVAAKTRIVTERLVKVIETAKKR